MPAYLPSLTRVRLNRCPSCGAACTDSAEWCTLCYADLRPKQVVEPAIEPAPVASPAHVDPPVEPAVDEAPVFTAAAAATAVAREPKWPCSGCGELMPLEESTCTVCGTPFLRDPVATPLASVTSMAPGRRALLMSVGVVLVTGVFLLLMLVVGALL